MSTEEMVNHPRHYGGDTIYETIKVLEEWLTPEQFIGFCRGSAIAYQARAGKKGLTDETVQDLEKAAWYTRYEADFRRRLSAGNIGETRALLLARRKLSPDESAKLRLALGGEEL